MQFVRLHTSSNSPGACAPASLEDQSRALGPSGRTGSAGRAGAKPVPLTTDKGTAGSEPSAVTRSANFSARHADSAHDGGSGPSTQHPPRTSCSPASAAVSSPGTYDVSGIVAVAPGVVGKEGAVVMLSDGDGGVEARDGGLVGDDPDHVGPPLDLVVHELQRVGRPDLLPVADRERVNARMSALASASMEATTGKRGSSPLHDLELLADRRCVASRGRYRRRSSGRRSRDAASPVIAPPGRSRRGSCHLAGRARCRPPRPRHRPRAGPPARRCRKSAPRPARPHRFRSCPRGRSRSSRGAWASVAGRPCRAQPVRRSTSVPLIQTAPGGEAGPACHSGRWPPPGRDPGSGTRGG